MGEGRPAGYSPTRPPSIMREGSSVQVICKGFHPTTSRHSENTGGKTTSQHYGIDYKMICYIYGHICTMTTLGRVGNTTYVDFRLFS